MTRLEDRALDAKYPGPQCMRQGAADGGAARRFDVSRCKSAEPTGNASVHSSDNVFLSHVRPGIPPCEEKQRVALCIVDELCDTAVFLFELQNQLVMMTKPEY